MAPPADTYTFIPPPPLPEFYTKVTTRRAPPLTPSETTATSGMPADGGDGNWQYADVKKSVSTTRALSSVSTDRDVPPLAVYHICRICLRPRSARYHRDHPIPADGVPPPPGICRRCRVAPAEDLDAIAVIDHRRESNAIRIGVGCLVPDEDLTSNTGMREKRTRRAMSDASWKEVDACIYRPRTSANLSSSPPREREEIIYRHIYETVPPSLVRSPVRPAVAPALPSPNTVDLASVKATRGSSERHTTICVPPPPPPQPPRVCDQVRDSEPSPPLARNASSRHSISSQPQVDRANALAAVRASSSSRSKHSSSSRLTPASIHIHTRDKSEAEIRRLARDEVERYRNAERRLERHSSPYAHGRMVPIERRIEVVKDTASEIPWRRPELARRDSRLDTEKDCSKPEPEPRRAVEVVVERRAAPPSDTPPDQMLRQSIVRQEEPSKRWQGVTPNSMPEECNIVLDERHRLSAKIEGDIPERVKELAETFGRQEQNQGKDSNDDQRKRQTREPGRGQQRPKQSEASGSARQGAERLPYPEDKHNSITIMPSPSSHVSRPARPARPAREAETEKNEGEYVYVERQKHFRDRTPSGAGYDTIETTKSYIHRNKPAGRQHADDEARYGRASDASSRVHFSKKVDISPTPPGSNASTSEFRDFSRRRKTELPERAEDLIAEYEHRGRQRSRDPYYDDERDDTPRADQRRCERRTRPSGSGETETVCSNLGRFARVTSESPSRERLEAIAQKARRPEPHGPFHDPNIVPSASMQVEDGSVASSDDWEVPYDQRRGGR